MNRLCTTVFTTLSLVFSPALKAEESPQAPTETAPAASEPEGTPVGAASSEGTNTAKKKQWQNIALAVGAVAVAVTALILVSTNDGHHQHNSD